MTVSQFPIEQLRVGQPIPFGLLDAAGHLLMARGTVVQNEAHRQQLLERGAYIDQQDADAYVRSLASKVDSMLLQNELLGRIAQARPSAPAAEGVMPLRKSSSPLETFNDLQMHAGKLLREAPQADFAPRLRKLQEALFALTQHNPDTVLLMLVVAATSELRQHSATHALLVAVVCDLAAAQLPGFQPEWREPLRSAALTMNIAMTALQDALALQAAPPDALQRAQIDSHARRGMQMLAEAGITDPLWLQAVLHHHDAPPGPLDALPPALQLARLIKRADIFTARLSPRRKRAALSGAAAAKAAYLDEHQQADDAGAAIIKATGIYPPGSFVRLASGEAAVVLRRGQRANEPLVACVLSRSGMPQVEPALRNTRLPAYAVTAGVAPQEVRLRLNVERLLRLL